MKAAFEDGCHLSKNAGTSEVGSRKQERGHLFQAADRCNPVPIIPIFPNAAGIDFTEFEHGLGVTPFAHIHFDAVTKNYRCVVEIKMKA